MRYLIPAGIAAAVIYAVTRKREPAPEPSPKGPDGLLVDQPCFGGRLLSDGTVRLSSDDTARIRAAVGNAAPQVPPDLAGLARVSWIASAAMRALCPQLPAPDAPHLISNYQQANGKGWTAAHGYALQVASGSAMPPPV